MKISITVKDDIGNIFGGEMDLELRTGGKKSGLSIPTGSKSSPTSTGHPRTPGEGLRTLHQKGVFKLEREFKAVEQELAKIDCNFPKPTLFKALTRAGFLTRHGKRGNYSWIQKFPPGV